MRSMLGACLVAMFLGGSGAGSLGCSDCAVRGQDPIVYTAGTLNESGTVYETMGPMDEMLHFPEGRVYEIPHGMGVDPATVDIFLSFRSQLTAQGDTGDEVQPNNIAPTAGNQAVIEAWDDEIVRIRNDTCAEFYVRVVMLADPDEVAAARANDGAAGASSIGAAGSGSE